MHFALLLGRLRLSQAHVQRKQIGRFVVVLSVEHLGGVVELEAGDRLDNLSDHVLVADRLHMLHVVELHVGHILLLPALPVLAVLQRTGVHSAITVAVDHQRTTVRERALLEVQLSWSVQSVAVVTMHLH